MTRAMLTRDGRTIQVYTVLLAGWNSYEIRRESQGHTFTEGTALTAEDASTRLATVVRSLRNSEWTLVTSD